MTAHAGACGLIEHALAVATAKHAALRYPAFAPRTRTLSLLFGHDISFEN